MRQPRNNRVFIKTRGKAMSVSHPMPNLRNGDRA
jgi:hypothetical protein